MKFVKIALVFALAPIFAQADPIVGQSTLKLDADNVAVRAKVARQEIRILDGEIRKLEDEISRLEAAGMTSSPLVRSAGMQTIRDGFSAIVSGLEIERAQLIGQRRSLLAEATPAAQ